MTHGAMAMTVMYNGIQFAPVSVKQSIVVPCPAEVLWSVVGKYGKGALWMGSVAGQPIFSQLLVRRYSALAVAVVASFMEATIVSVLEMPSKKHIQELAKQQALLKAHV